MLILINKIFYEKNKENFTNQNNEQIDKMVNDLYIEDKNNLKKLFDTYGMVSNSVKDSDTGEIKKFKIPSLNVNPSFNYLPMYSIVPFYRKDNMEIPNGWVICDGRKFTDIDNTEQTTPNLTKRFIMGTPENGAFNEANGDTSYPRSLKKENLPANHTHTMGEGRHQHNKYPTDLYFLEHSFKNLKKGGNHISPSPYIAILKAAGRPDKINNLKGHSLVMAPKNFGSFLAHIAKADWSPYWQAYPSKSSFQEIGDLTKKPEYHPNKRNNFFDGHSHGINYDGGTDNRLQINNLKGKFPPYYEVIFIMKVPASIVDEEINSE